MSTRNKTVLRVALGLLVLVAAVAAISTFSRWESPLERLILWLRGLGVSGVVLLALVYVPLATCMLPTWPLTWSAGFIFGMVPGSIGASIGGTLGALAGFAIGRFVARDFVHDRLGRRPLVAALLAAVEQEGFKIVLLSRLSPAFPYNVLNYLFGVTDLPWRTFLAASWLGMLPITVLHVYMGTAIKNVADLVQGRAHAPSGAARAMLVVGIVATFLVTIVLTQTARRSLDANLRRKRATVEPSE